MQWGDLQSETCDFPVPATSHARLDICNLAGQKAHFPPSTAAACCALSSSCVVPSLLPPLLAHTDSMPGWFVSGCGRLDVAAGLSPCSKQAGGMETKVFSGTVAALCSIYLFNGISLWRLGKVSFQPFGQSSKTLQSLFLFLRHVWCTFTAFVSLLKLLQCSYFMANLSFCVSFIGFNINISRDLAVEIYTVFLKKGGGQWQCILRLDRKFTAFGRSKEMLLSCCAAILAFLKLCH